MSSTARGGQRSPADFYATPAWPVRRLFERLNLPGGGWLECAAGEGAIIKTVNSMRSDVVWTATELRDECRAPLIQSRANHIYIADFLNPGALWIPGAYEVVITNPPFSLAEEFIAASLGLAPWVVMLLRLNYFGSEKRNKFFQHCMPDAYVVPDRISFTADGKADSIEYMWAVWGPDRNRRSGSISVLECTPVEERRSRASRTELGLNVVKNLVPSVVGGLK